MSSPTREPTYIDLHPMREVDDDRARDILGIMAGVGTREPETFAQAMRQPFPFGVTRDEIIFIAQRYLDKKTSSDLFEATCQEGDVFYATLARLCGKDPETTKPEEILLYIMDLHRRLQTIARLARFRPEEAEKENDEPE